MHGLMQKLGRIIRIAAERQDYFLVLAGLVFLGRGDGPVELRTEAQRGRNEFERCVGGPGTGGAGGECGEDTADGQAFYEAGNKAAGGWSECIAGEEIDAKTDGSRFLALCGIGFGEPVLFGQYTDALLEHAASEHCAVDLQQLVVGDEREAVMRRLRGLVDGDSGSCNRHRLEGPKRGFCDCKRLGESSLGRNCGNATGRFNGLKKSRWRAIAIAARWPATPSY